MGRIVVSENVTADGVMKDPTGEDGTAGGGWFTRVSGADVEQWGKVLAEEAFAADVLLMGRGTYDYFIARGWPERTGPWAERLREVQKYVVSTTLRDPEWSNTTVVPDGAVEAAQQLAREVDGEILVNASGQLVSALWTAGLVDELRLIVFPMIVGGGGAFADVAGQTAVQLREARRLGDGLVQLRYSVVR